MANVFCKDCRYMERKENGNIPSEPRCFVPCNPPYRYDCVTGNEVFRYARSYNTLLDCPKFESKEPA
jgi:hypothetical protein